MKGVFMKNHAAKPTQAKMMQWAKVLLLLAAVLGQIYGHILSSVAGFGLAFLFCFIWERYALSRLGSPRFWIVVGLVAAAAALVSGGAAGNELSLSISLSGLSTAAMLVCRAATFFIVAVVVTRHVSHRSLSSALHRVGLRRLGISLGLAVNVAPLLVDTARDAHGQLSLRKQECGVGFFTRMELLATTLLLKAAELAEDASFSDSLRRRLSKRVDEASWDDQPIIEEIE